MGMFSLPGNSGDVPDTITGEEMLQLGRRAQEANPESPFSRRNVERRQRDDEQREKRWLS
jgi:hypothetical protein